MVPPFVVANFNKELLRSFTLPELFAQTLIISHHHE
nr:MAG TPA: hypothetical protein [Caudoviricetes sp.]